MRSRKNGNASLEDRTEQSNEPELLLNREAEKRDSVLAEVSPYLRPVSSLSRK